METIQVVLDAELLRATNGAARRARVNRSALVRQALREYLKRVDIQRLEALDRKGYQKHPQDEVEAAYWEQVATWPER